MNIETYFEREYNYLQIAGQEFAEKHPALGGKLRLSERQRKDPFVERLFEGFAFLSGRIHERLDDEIPEMTGGLLEQLFPHFLRPFPSCAILEVNPIQGAITKPIAIERHSELQTPTGKYKVKYAVSAGPEEKARIIEKTEPAEFIFQTTQSLTVRPMRLKNVRTEDAPDGTTALILQIHPDRNVDYESLALKRLRLYLHGADSLKFTLLLYLTKYVNSIAVSEVIGDKRNFVAITPFQTGIPELSSNIDYESEEFALVPYARQTFTGYRLLQEYFSFPERFFFIDIEGLDQYRASKEGHPFEIKINFSRRLSNEFRPSVNNIFLHCTPIVNLFNRPTEEVAVTQRMPEYYIIPDLDRRKSREIYSVNKVTGVGENKLEQYKYVPVTSYDILEVHDIDYEYKRFYSIVRRPFKSDMAETHIRIFGPTMEQDVFPKETLSIEATMSNGFLPAKYLEVKSITEPINFPTGVTVSNLTVPSDILPNPDRHNYLWSLISHLTLNYSTLADAETLKSILSLYNWSTVHNNPNKKRIQAITRVHTPQTKNLYRNRSLIRGIEFKIEVDPGEFPYGEATVREGDIHLMGLVMSRFLSQYVTINSYVILTIIESGTNKQYTWEPNLGKNLPV